MAERIALKSGRCWSFGHGGKVQNELTTPLARATSRHNNENMQQTGISSHVWKKFVMDVTTERYWPFCHVGK